MHPMSGKLDRARPIFVCWSERSEASDYREIVQCGHAPECANRFAIAHRNALPVGETLSCRVSPVKFISC